MNGRRSLSGIPCLRLIDLEEGSGVILRAVQNKIGHALAIAFLLILAVMRVQELKAVERGQYEDGGGEKTGESETRE